MFVTRCISVVEPVDARPIPDRGLPTRPGMYVKSKRKHKYMLTSSLVYIYCILRTGFKIQVVSNIALARPHAKSQSKQQHRCNLCSS